MKLKYVCMIHYFVLSELPEGILATQLYIEIKLLNI